ncbi:MAG: hypothetical protein LBJ95_04585 [Oscillospiraceae bacterium]|jgi:hypothetical protein|nr:hypothetical protein [Oscillospiraceae bacterium]
MKKRNAPQKTDLDSTKNLPKLNDNDLMNVTGGNGATEEESEEPENITTPGPYVGYN